LERSWLGECGLHGRCWKFLGASARTIKVVSDPAILEAMACADALVLAEKLTVSSDWLEVINMTKTKNLCRYSAILVEIENLSSNLELVSFQHEYRESNQDAHLIARNAIAVQFGRRVWFLETSDFVTLFAQVK
jgi:hypothetical protein